MKSARILISLAVLTAAASAALADGMIVPVRPELRVRGNWAVKYHHVDITVRDQVAEVAIDQEFVNTGSGMIEVEYLFPIPPGAAIDSMTLIVNGKEFAAKLLPADEARKAYEDIVRTKKDPALLEYAGFGMYRTRAFPLEPGKPCKVIVTYKNTPKRDHDLVEVWYPLNTEKFSAKPIESVRVSVDIKTKQNLMAVYSPTHDLKVDRKDPTRVIATYEAKNDLPTTDFQLFYKAADKDVAATLLTWQPDSKTDGYFMMLVSPNPQGASQRVTPKDIVAVLDHSGSMSGEKIAQAKEALRYIVRNLNKDDRFNIVLYNDQIEPMFDSMRSVNDRDVQDAMDRIDRLSATGGTNIDEALTAALAQCTDKHRPTYVLFFTDGQPTVGKTSEADILSDASAANKNKARIFAFGVGYEPNVRLLDRLAGDNRGRSDYVKPKEPIETKVSSLYAKIKNPVMTDLTASIEGLRLKDMYPRHLDDLFDGDQIVLVGRYDCDDARKLPTEEVGLGGSTLVIKGRYEGRERAFEYPVTVNTGPGAGTYRFVEKLWAIRRVGWLLDEIQLRGKSQEVIDELVRLSRDYGIMTPYTSFLADERTPLGSREGLRAKGTAAAAPLDKVSDLSGQFGAMNRQALNTAESPSVTLAPGEPARTESKADMARGGAPATLTANIGYAGQKAYEDGKPGGAVENVRQVGNNYVLYRRGQIWMMPNTAGLDLEKDTDKVVQIKRFSDEYFNLVRANTSDQNAVMASQKSGEQLLVNFRGQAYNITD
jgi:Ca-activated chloride channel family protein